MVKSTQIKHGNGESLNQTVFEKKPCCICGKKSHVWAYVKKGNMQVCSKACYDAFVKQRGW